MAFRSNTMATKAVECFVKLVGSTVRYFLSTVGIHAALQCQLYCLVVAFVILRTFFNELSVQILVYTFVILSFLVFCPLCMPFSSKSLHSVSLTGKVTVSFMRNRRDLRVFVWRDIIGLHGEILCFFNQRCWRVSIVRCTVIVYLDHCRYGCAVLGWTEQLVPSRFPSVINVDHSKWNQ